MQWTSCSFIAAFFAVVGICNGRPTGGSNTSIQCRRLWSGPTRVSSEGSEQHLSFDFPLDVDDWFVVFHFRFPVLEVELDSHDDYHKYAYDYGDENRNVIVSPDICCKKAKRNDLFGAVVRVARGMPPPRIINATLYVATNQGSFLQFNLCDPKAQGQRYQLTTSENVEDAVEETSTRYADEQTVDDAELNTNTTDMDYETSEKLSITNNRRQSTVSELPQNDEVSDDLLTIVDQASKMHLYSPDVHEEALVGRSTTKRSVPSSPPTTQMAEEELDAETTPPPVSFDQEMDLVLPSPLTPTQEVFNSSFDNSSAGNKLFSANESTEQTPGKTTLENEEYFAQDEQGSVLMEGPSRENGTQSDHDDETGDEEVATGSPKKPSNGTIHTSLHQDISATEDSSADDRPILVDDSHLAVRPESASASDVAVPDEETSSTKEEVKAADKTSQLDANPLLNVTQDDAEEILDVSDQHEIIGSPGYTDEEREPEPSNMEDESIDEDEESEEISQDTAKHNNVSKIPAANESNTEQAMSKLPIHSVIHGTESTLAHSNAHLANNLTAGLAKNSSSLNQKDDALSLDQKNASIPIKIKLQVGSNVTKLEESMSFGDDLDNGSMDDSGPEDQGDDMGMQADSSLPVLEDIDDAEGEKLPEKYGSLFNDTSAPTKDQGEESDASKDNLASTSHADEEEMAEFGQTTFSPMKVIPNDKRRNQTEFNASSANGKLSEENLAVFTSNTTEDDLVTPIDVAEVRTNLTRITMNTTNPPEKHPTFDLEEIDGTSFSDLDADSSSSPPQKEPFKREDQPTKASNAVHHHMNITGKINDTESEVHSTGIEHEIISHFNDYGEEEVEESEEHSTGVKHEIHSRNITSHEHEKDWSTESEENSTGIEPEIISHFNDHGDHEEDWDQDLPENGPVVNITSSGFHNLTGHLGHSDQQVVKTNGTSLNSEDDDIPVVAAGSFPLNGSKNDNIQHVNDHGHEWDDELSSVDSEDHHVSHEDPGDHVTHDNSSSHHIHGHGQIPAINGSDEVEEQDYETLGALGAIGNLQPPSGLPNLTSSNSSSMTALHDDESPVVGLTLDGHNGTIDNFEPLVPDTEETTAGLITSELPGVQQQGLDEDHESHHGIHGHEQEDTLNISSGSSGSSVYKPVKPDQGEEVHGLETASQAHENDFSGQYHGIPDDVAYDDLNDYDNGQKGSDPDAYSHETHDYREDVLPEDARPVGGAELDEEETDDPEEDHELEKTTQNPTEVKEESAVANITESVEESGVNSTEVSSTASTTISPDATEVYLDDTAEKAQILPGTHGHEGAKEPEEYYGIVPEQPFVDYEMPADVNETTHLHGHHHHSNFSESHFNGSVSEGHEHESTLTHEGDSSHDHGHDENPGEHHGHAGSSDHHEHDEASIESHKHGENSSGDHKHPDTAIEVHEHDDASNQDNKHDHVANEEHVHEETSSGDHDLQDTSTEPQEHDDASTEDDEHEVASTEDHEHEDPSVGGHEEDDATTEDHDHGAAGHDHEHKHENGTTEGLEHGDASGQGHDDGGASADDHEHEHGTTEDHEHQVTSSDDHHHEHGLNENHEDGSDTSDQHQHGDEEREHAGASDEDHAVDSIHNHGDLLPGADHEHFHEVHRPNPADTSTLKGITEKIPGLTDAPGEGRKASKVQVEPPGNRSNSAASIKPGLAAIFALMSAAYIFIWL